MSTGMGISAGTNVVGGELQGWAALLDKWNMQKTYENEARQQAAFRDQAMQQFGRGVRQSTPARAEGYIGQGANLRQQEYSKLGQVPLGSGFSPMSGYKSSPDDAYLSLVGGARANLGGYSDWAVQQAINNIRNQQALNQITSFAGGQAKNVFPLQMYKAQHSNDALAAIGQAIQSIGGAAGNYAQLYGQTPPAPSYQAVQSGNMLGPSVWSGYGTTPPLGTGYNAFTDQSTLFGAPSYYIPGY